MISWLVSECLFDHYRCFLLHAFSICIVINTERAIPTVKTWKRCSGSVLVLVLVQASAGSQIGFELAKVGLCQWTGGVWTIRPVRQFPDSAGSNNRVPHSRTCWEDILITFGPHRSKWWRWNAGEQWDREGRKGNRGLRGCGVKLVYRFEWVQTLNWKRSPVDNYCSKLSAISAFWCLVLLQVSVEASVPIWEKIIGHCFGGIFCLPK